MKNQINEAVRAVSEGKPKGGARLEALLLRAVQSNRLTLFMPWAAPPSGRTDLRYEYATLGWFAALATGLGSIVAVETILMPADTYAKRNGFNMSRAGNYWATVTDTATQILNGVSSLQVTPASAIEQAPPYREYLAREAYRFEKLLPQQQAKIIAAAAKYTNATGQAAYENAADYTMRRAAEASYVSGELGALWVSLNYPERDIMCADTPRMYVPEPFRTPWLKETA